MTHRWRLTKASSTTDRWQVTCSCGQWRGCTETDVQAQLLAAEHGREKGTHVVKIESRDDYRRREQAARPQGSAPASQARSSTMRIWARRILHSNPPRRPLGTAGVVASSRCKVEINVGQSSSSSCQASRALLESGIGR